MKINQPIITGLLGGLSFIVLSCGGGEVTHEAPKLNQQKLEKELIFLEGNLTSLGDAGYTAWTPTTAATELVTTLNASTMLLPEEEEEFRQAGIKPKAAIPYVLNQPTEAWQIVLVPDDGLQVIRVEAYGQDLENPLIEKELPCCNF